jgi:hypothetical protein
MNRGLMLVAIILALVLGLVYAFGDRMQNMSPMMWASLAAMMGSLVLVSGNSALKGASGGQMIRYAGIWVLIISAIALVYFALRGWGIDL